MLESFGPSPEALNEWMLGPPMSRPPQPPPGARLQLSVGTRVTGQILN
jgi:hypothetical protein